MKSRYSRYVVAPLGAVKNSGNAACSSACTPSSENHAAADDGSTMDTGAPCSAEGATGTGSAVRVVTSSSRRARLLDVACCCCCSAGSPRVRTLSLIVATRG